MRDGGKSYWKNFLGIPRYKIDWFFKCYIHKVFGITFDKLHDQRQYWNSRGAGYFEEVFQSQHYTYEIFFQDMFINELRSLSFENFFEAGCGFGWNVKRVKQEFPNVKIEGIDFSMPQLMNSKIYLPHIYMPAVQGDACLMPFKDKAFDIGFTLGVFMNIHPAKIEKAIDEMIRVSKKYIIHLEWDQDNTKPALREKRIFKTNIISHNYRCLYEQRGKRIIKFKTYKDFEESFNKRFKSTKVSTWEQFEGPEKYILLVVEL
ncbi:MAG: class I SAM-dependent methyltransferase [Proteobacteria bacterium]|nr:class I SAM-dependent methyltransferase [Pseudomonadota bacterium]